MTTVLPARGTVFTASGLGAVVETNSDWWFMSDDETGGLFYNDLLPAGEYDVRIQMRDGPAWNGPFPERAPADGVYVSNRVHLTVVEDGAPLRVQPRLGRVKGRRASVFPHRGVGLVRAAALRTYGVRSRTVDNAVSLECGERRVTLPLAGLAGAAPTPRRAGGPPIPAIAAKDDTFVPLRYVASQLGMKLVYDPRARVYGLQPTHRGKAARQKQLPARLAGTSLRGR